MCVCIYADSSMTMHGNEANRVKGNVCSEAGTFTRRAALKSLHDSRVSSGDVAMADRGCVISSLPGFANMSKGI